ncbi:MFS transporter [Methylobacterium oryzihabitans]|uniref:MFS transporter n=1 Tax=Methylobacterium oryzihabitans TaxID=2499852 RepID=A0A437NYK0_9HYPH|nr:MFS transporter [Methylobacterium oryzihabitans]RVU15083.1 MFS transporter [Methylobacterium oryzihabitans]
MPPPATASVAETDISARLDRLPWGRFHTLVVLALGITWVLDGLEVTLAGALVGALRASPVLQFSAADVGLATASYLAGAVLGAIGFGWLTDRLGRKKLFFITLAVYLAATAATGFSWNLWSFCLFRFLTGAGIGGEYTAINSTIQELIPARARGWTDLVINGSFWLGAVLGAGTSLVVLDPDLFAPDWGWRAAFFLGAGLGLVILLLRTWIPESPRWLMTHGRTAEAEAVVAGIEERFRREGHDLESEPFPTTRLRQRTHTPLREVFSTLARYRSRVAVGLVLMSAQAFFFNAIFFTYGLILIDFFGVPGGGVGWYILPFAAGNFFGPLLLGRFFDTIGRRPMIAFTYAMSGLLLAGSGVLFQQDLLTATTMTACWMVVFFFASAAASSAYLTVSEVFPLEIRAFAIALFYAFGTAVGAAGPALFGVLIEGQSRTAVLGGYLLASVLMVVAAVVAGIWGVAAERKSLEDVARPLAAD